MTLRRALPLAALVVGVGVATAEPARVGPGTYRPVFPASPAEREIAVEPFWLDREPVTNAQFLEFVRARPQWARDKARSIVVDTSYLSHWAGPTTLGTARPRGPVVHVSWFAARAYCAWRGGRLPREAEWELAALAGEKSTEDPGLEARILAWTAQPTPAVLPDVGGVANVWGIRDLHGLVWEWVEDWNAALVSADSRDATRMQMCGAEAASSKDPKAYATFLRMAARSAMQAKFTTPSFGFRCAYEEKP